eukprot:TRINITY_DN5166_c0_g2_i18.p1 TRINITY_DN5166_c0_g2~~TRINITY_DN5166_c0_g2_i18.p1  ORF type:complete len:351 (-),score=105.64 TRINITY_DN5166_c0_g2_i18:165-1217(-)
MEELESFYRDFVSGPPGVISRGLLQCIGFKEFLPYLEFLQNSEYIPKERERIFSSCLRSLEEATHRYARGQIQWILSHLSHRCRHPIFCLDSTRVFEVSVIPRNEECPEIFSSTSAEGNSQNTKQISSGENFGTVFSDSLWEEIIFLPSCEIVSNFLKTPSHCLYFKMLEHKESQIQGSHQSLQPQKETEQQKQQEQVQEQKQGQQQEQPEKGQGQEQQQHQPEQEQGQQQQQQQQQQQPKQEQEQQQEGCEMFQQSQEKIELVFVPVDVKDTVKGRIDLPRGFIGVINPQQTLSSDEKQVDEWQKFFCESCEREVNGRHEWDVHLSSRKHKKRKLAIKKKLGVGAVQQL